MAEHTSFKFRDHEGAVVGFVGGTESCYVSVLRAGEDEDRVAELSPPQALRLAEALLTFARANWPKKLAQGGGQ